MDTAPTAPEPADAPAGAPASAAASPYGPDRRAAERTERQLALLDRLAEDAAAMVTVIREQAEQAKWCGSEGPEMVECLARAVRQTMAFANKVDADARMTAEQRAAAQSRREAAEIRAMTRLANHSASALGAEFRRIAAEIDQEGLFDPIPAPRRGAKSDRENLLSGLNERFGDKSVDDELNGRTYGEILTTIMADIGATADLSVFSAEEMARVYGPARLRRRAMAQASPQAAPDGAKRAADDPGGGAAPPEPAQQGPPEVASGHDPP